MGGKTGDASLSVHFPNGHNGEAGQMEASRPIPSHVGAGAQARGDPCFAALPGASAVGWIATGAAQLQPGPLRDAALAGRGFNPLCHNTGWPSRPSRSNTKQTLLKC